MNRHSFLLLLVIVHHGVVWALPFDLQEDRMEVIGGVAPQFYADGWGVSAEGGLFLPLEQIRRFSAFGTATVGVQFSTSEAGDESHNEIDLLLNVRSGGEIVSTTLPAENPLTWIGNLFDEGSNRSYRVGVDASLLLGGGIINYWRTADRAFLFLSEISLRPEVGVFLDSEKTLLTVGAGYQIDFTGAAPRSFITFPVRVVLHDQKPLRRSP